MSTSATNRRILVLLIFLTAPALVHAQSMPIDTGTLQTVIYANGNIGGDCTNVEGLTFNGVQGLCALGLLMATSPTDVIGVDYANVTDNGWTAGPLSASTDFPYPALDEGVEAIFSATDLSVVLNAYWGADTDYLLLKYDVTNTSASAVDLVPGMFVDWDIDLDTYDSNMAEFDTDADAMWAFDNTTTGYVGGVAFLNTDMEGWTCFFEYLDGTPPDPTGADFYATMTTPGPASCTIGEDLRGPIGTTPLALGAGETETLLYGVVLGEDETDFLTNLALLKATLNPIDTAIHDTGEVQLEVFDNGKIGAYLDNATTLNIGAGFVFNGENGLFEGQVLVATAPDQVSGSVYDFNDTPLEWTTTVPLSVAAPPTGYDTAFLAGYEDSSAPNPIGVEVTQLSYSNAGDPFVIVSLDVTNTTASAITGAYIGLYADWDIGDYEQNLAEYDAGSQLLYTWDTSDPSSLYYGVVSLDGFAGIPVSGVTFEALPDDILSEDLLYTGLTTVAPATTPDDMRTILGVGPFDLDAGATQTVHFAFVGGVDQDDIIANAYAAQGVGVANEPPVAAPGLRLGNAYPNPFRGRTTVSFSLDAPQALRLAVYDVLGRHVTTLVDGTLTAGEHTAVWDASGLASGVYLVRIETAGGALMQRVLLTN